MSAEPNPALDMPPCTPLSAADNLAAVQRYILAQATNNRVKKTVDRRVDEKGCSKILVDSSAFNGCFGFYEISDDIYLAVTEVRFLKKQVFNFIGENWIRFHFRISGGNSVVVKNITQYDTSGTYAELCLHPQGVDRYEIYPEDERHLWATIFCTPQSLYETLDLQPDNLPRAVERAFGAGGTQYYAQKTELSGAMCSAVRDLATAPLGENVLDVYRKAKVAELVCLVADAFNQEQQKTGPKIRINRRDTDRLEEVRERLIQDVGLALNLGQLVRETGLNRNKLTYGFKEMFGVTMSEFCRQHRFKQAYELLNETDMNISEIAYIAGYSNVANFSNAFKRYYGFSPKHSRLNRPGKR